MPVSEHKHVFGHVANRGSHSLVRMSYRTWHGNLGRLTASPGPRWAARCQMASILSHSPETPASRCATRESRRGADERGSPPATHQTRGDTGTGRYRVESAMCKEFANNQECKICGACCSQGRQRSAGGGRTGELGRVNATPEGFHGSLLPDRCAFL